MAGCDARRANQAGRRARRSLPTGWSRAYRASTGGAGKLDQRIALLRHVEALRMYAAEHDGALPAKLSDVSVPLPDDPFTGKPFHYEQTGGTAHIRGTPPARKQNDPLFKIHFEVTIQK